MAQNSTDRVELLLDRLATMTKSFTEASERSTRRLDVQIKGYVDRGAQATDQALRVIERELQRQIAAMKRELPRLERAAQSLRDAAQPVLGGKPAATARHTRGTKPTVKPAPVKKASAKKAPPKKKAPARPRKVAAPAA